MADTKPNEDTVKASGNDETVATVKPTAPKGKQISAVFSDAEQEQLAELRWQGRHDKTSDVLKAAVKFYAEAKLPKA